MKTIIYLIQVSACTGIFYIFYHAVLSKLTFFTINRWYLLATLLISFIIPAITISEDTIPQEYRVSSVSFSTIAQTYVPGASANTEAITEPFKWVSLLPVLYFSIAGIIAVYFLITLFILLRRIYNDQSAKTGNIKLLKTEKRYKNGSFFNCIFINDEKLSSEELEQIIAHELVHVEQKHSVDKIIARIAQVILWFNPFIYAWSNAIDANHEYEVDHKVALNSDKEAYAQLILRLVASGDGPLYHHFSKFPLSKRITLLFTKPTKNMKKLFYALILPLIAISCLAFANRESNLLVRGEKKSAKTILVPQQPIFSRESKIIKGHTYYIFKVKTPDGKGMEMTSNSAIRVAFYINNKLYSEEQTKNLNESIINKSDNEYASGLPDTFVILGADLSNYQYLFWIGSKPQRTPEYLNKETKNAAIHKRFKDKTIDAKVIDYSYSPSKKLQDGFIVQSGNETFKIFVQVSEAKLLNSKIKPRDNVSILVTNAAYWKDTVYPVLRPWTVTKGNIKIISKGRVEI